MARRTAVTVTVVVLLLAGCAPRTPGEDSWREDAHRALSDVTSSVQTARVALREAGDDRIYDSYLQTVVVDAEEAAGGAAQKFAGFQPPAIERARYETVTTEMDDAASLLSEVRIAVVAGDEQEYPALSSRLRETFVALDKLEEDLRHPPRNTEGQG